MRDVDPKTAPLIPVDISMNWNHALPLYEYEFEFVYWIRAEKRFVRVVGRLKASRIEDTPGDKQDFEWLENIGAINGD